MITTNNHNENDNLGLCSTCTHIAGCITRQTFKGKIMQCEEFETPIVVAEIHSTAFSQKKSANPYSNLKGLCMNCDLVATCTLPKAVTGVWHCNEYK